MKKQLVKVEKFGSEIPADKNRMVYDFYNEELYSSGLTPDYIFFGDSITYHFDIHLYFNRLGLIINRGIGGDTTTYMLKRIDGDVLQFSPKNIVFLAGINDLMSTEDDRWWKIKGKDEKLVLKETVENYKKIVKKCKGIKLYFCSVLPVKLCEPFDNNKYAKLIPLLNAEIKKLCDGKNVVYVDYYSATVDKDGLVLDGLTFDGVHPISKGYEIMKNVLLTTINDK